MNQCPLLTEGQRTAEVHTETPDRILWHRMTHLVLLQRGEQLHPDENVPADLAGMRYHLIILTANNIRMPFQRGHDRNLLDDLIDHPLEVAGDRLLVHAVVDGRAVIPRGMGHPDHLQSRAAGDSEVVLLQFIYRTERACTELTYDLPVSKHSGTHNIFHRKTLSVHQIPSSG